MSVVPEDGLRLAPLLFHRGVDLPWILEIMVKYGLGSQGTEAHKLNSGRPQGQAFSYFIFLIQYDFVNKQNTDIHEGSKM